MPHADGKHDFVYKDKSYSISTLNYAKCTLCGQQAYLHGQREHNLRQIQALCGVTVQ